MHATTTSHQRRPHEACSRYRPGGEECCPPSAAIGWGSGYGWRAPTVHRTSSRRGIGGCRSHPCKTLSMAHAPPPAALGPRTSSSWSVLWPTPSGRRYGQPMEVEVSRGLVRFVACAYAGEAQGPSSASRLARARSLRTWPLPEFSAVPPIAHHKRTKECVRDRIDQTRLSAGMSLDVIWGSRCSVALPSPATFAPRMDME